MWIPASIGIIASGSVRQSSAAVSCGIRISISVRAASIAPATKKRRFAGRAFRTVCGMTGHGQTVAAARHRYDDADVGPRPGICFGNLAAGKPFLVKRVSAAHEQNVTACEERFFTKV